MPYFYKPNTVNVLFIHIPKTGGTSAEQYFSHKYNIPLNQYSLFTYRNTSNNGMISLQHYTYENIIYNPSIRLIEGYETFTIVRNPYYRVVSDIFFLGLASIHMNKKEIYKIITTYYTQYNHDNHTKPQYEFIYDMSNNCLYDNIYVLKTEDLTEEMHAFGYIDFDIHITPTKKKNETKYS